MKKLIFLLLFGIMNCQAILDKPNTINKYEIYQYGVKIDTLCSSRYIPTSFVTDGIYFKYIGKCDE